MVKFDKSKDFIRIIAPASKGNDAIPMLAETEKLLQSKNFKYIVADKIFDGENLPFFAASKENRIGGLKQALLDPNTKIILAFRGGYGCTEIMLEFLNVKISTPKILIGFSDITALHVLFNQNYKMPSIHGSIFPATDKFCHFQDIINILEGQRVKLKLQNINKTNNSKNKISGKLAGGNLTVYCNTLGTKLSPNIKNKILVLEDVNEKGYHIHRHLIHLKNAGIFRHLKAVIFGDFIKSDENLNPAIEDFCFNHISNIPSFYVKDIGHGKINNPIILGTRSIINGEYFEQLSPFRLI